MRQFSRFLFGTFLLLVMAIPSAGAEDLQRKREIALGIMEQTGMMDQFEALSSMAFEIHSGALKNNPNVSSDILARFEELFLQEVAASKQELAEDIADIYAESFNEAELVELGEFYESALGQRLIEKMPALMQRSLALGTAWGQRLSTRVIQEILDQLRSEGHDI